MNTELFLFSTGVCLSVQSWMGRTGLGGGVMRWEAELKVDLKRGRGKGNIVARVVEINIFRS